MVSHAIPRWIKTPEALRELWDGKICLGKDPGVWPVAPSPGVGSSGDRRYPGGGWMCALEGSEQENESVTVSAESSCHRDG